MNSSSEHNLKDSHTEEKILFKFVDMSTKGISVNMTKNQENVGEGIIIIKNENYSAICDVCSWCGFHISHQQKASKRKFSFFQR